MKSRILPSALGSLALIASLAGTAPALAAADDAPASTTPASDSALPGKMRPVVGAMITGTLGTSRATTTNPDGSLFVHDPGSRYELYAGAEFPLAPSGLALRLTVGVHVSSSSSSSNGASEHSTSIPLEAALMYPLNDVLRLGGGVRFTAHHRFSGPGGNTSDQLTSTPGGVVLADYMITPHFSVEGRYVVERDEVPGGSSIDASHFGLGVSAMY